MSILCSLGRHKWHEVGEDWYMIDGNEVFKAVLEAWKEHHPGEDVDITSNRVVVDHLSYDVYEKHYNDSAPCYKDIVCPRCGKVHYRKAKAKETLANLNAARP